MKKLFTAPLALLALIVLQFKLAESITLENVYKRLLEKERHVENSFTAQFIRPIGSVDGEFIWPRSYSKPSYLFFDENGAAYNVRPRPSLKEILARTSWVGAVPPAAANSIST